MVEEQRPSAVNRRGFIKGLALVATAAATGGGAAALLKRESKTVITPVEPVTAPLPPTASTLASPAPTSDLMGRLAAAQAENMRLRAELEAAQRRVSTLETSNGDSGRVNEALQTELAAANERAGLLAGLVALYEELEEVDLGDALNGGMSAVGEALGTLTGQVPSLETGLARGAEILDQLDEEIPALQGAQAWLGYQVDRLEAFYLIAQSLLANVVESAGTFLELLGKWFQDVLRWIPFGAGDRAAEVAEALTDLLRETPDAILGLRQNVAGPLETWLAGDGEDVALRRNVVKPLREETLQPASGIAASAQQAHSAFVSQLEAPLQERLARRQAVRELIAQYREKYNTQI